MREPDPPRSSGVLSYPLPTVYPKNILHTGGLTTKQAEALFNLANAGVLTTVHAHSAPTTSCGRKCRARDSLTAPPLWRSDLATPEYSVACGRWPAHGGVAEWFIAII